MTENLSTDFGITNGRTTIMSLNSSGRNFVVSSSAKVAENGRADDPDEASSGYSSRESRYGEKRDSRGCSQKAPPKIVLLVEEDERGALSVNGGVAVGKKLQDLQQDSGELIEIKRESPVVFNADGELEDRILLSKQETNSLENRIVTDCDTELKDCITSYSSRSRSEEIVALADSRAFRRQPRIELEDDTLRHFPLDKTKENEFELNDTKRVDSNICFNQRKEYKDGATQTDFAFHELFEECLSLKKVNGELVEKLTSSNNRFAVTIKYLEKQLNNAASEISKLKSHLSSVTFRPSPCNRCGYCSDGEVTELQRQSSSKTRRNSINSNGMKKAISTNSLKTYPYHQTHPAAQQPKLLKYIVKGENPDEVKTSLLEKNKSLKDEIQYLKEKERNGLASSNVTASRNQDVSETVDDLVTDKQTTVDSNTPRDEKAMVEDVRWKQSGYRVARRPKRSTTNRPQCTSAAFRTIHVTKWGPQM